jgi:hypothetical protein
MILEVTMKTLIVSLLFIVACGSGSSSTGSSNSNTKPADASAIYYSCGWFENAYPAVYKAVMDKQSKCCDTVDICLGEGDPHNFCSSFEGKTYVEVESYIDTLASMSCDEFIKSSLGCCSFPAEPNNSEEIIIPAV